MPSSSPRPQARSVLHSLLCPQCLAHSKHRPTLYWTKENQVDFHGQDKVSFSEVDKHVSYQLLQQHSSNILPQALFSRITTDFLLFPNSSILFHGVCLSRIQFVFPIPDFICIVNLLKSFRLLNLPIFFISLLHCPCSLYMSGIWLIMTHFFPVSSILLWISIYVYIDQFDSTSISCL
jgi:hypothetical protein